MDDDGVPFPEQPQGPQAPQLPTVIRVPRVKSATRSVPAPEQEAQARVAPAQTSKPSARPAKEDRPGNARVAPPNATPSTNMPSADQTEGLSTVDRRRAIFSEREARQEVHMPASIRQMDKRQLRKGQWQEVADRLKTERVSGRRVLRIFRYAVDDLRLLKALEEAGMEGRVVVTDSLERADVVLASARKRTSKKVDVSEAKAAAQNAGVPFVELRAVSALRVMEAIAPLMGIPIPPHLLQRSQAASPYLPPHDQRLKEMLALVEHCGQLQADGSQPASAAAGATTASLAGAEAQERLGPPPNLDWLDVDYPGDPPKQKGDMVGHKHPVIRAVKRGSKIRKKGLQKLLAEESAPW